MDFRGGGGIDIYLCYPLCFRELRPCGGVSTLMVSWFLEALFPCLCWTVVDSAFHLSWSAAYFYRRPQPYPLPLLGPVLLRRQCGLLFSGSGRTFQQFRLLVGGRASSFWDWFPNLWPSYSIRDHFMALPHHFMWAAMSPHDFCFSSCGPPGIWSKGPSKYVCISSVFLWVPCSPQYRPHIDAYLGLACATPKRLLKDAPLQLLNAHLQAHCQPLRDLASLHEATVVSGAHDIHAFVSLLFVLHLAYLESSKIA